MFGDERKGESIAFGVVLKLKVETTKE